MKVWVVVAACVCARILCNSFKDLCDVEHVDHVGGFKLQCRNETSSMRMVAFVAFRSKSSLNFLSESLKI